MSFNSKFGSAMAAATVFGFAARAELPAPPSSVSTTHHSQSAQRDASEIALAAKLTRWREDVSRVEFMSLRPPGKLKDSEIVALAARCAPEMPSSVILGLVHVESAGVPLTIKINGAKARSMQFSDKAAATATAEALILQGSSIDLGLAQINSKTIERLGLDRERIFDPCYNLAAASAVFQAAYRTSARRASPQVPLIDVALSYYNTGNGRAGLINGYAAKNAKIRSERGVRRTADQSR